MISVIPRKTLIAGVPLQQIWMLQAKDISKNSTRSFFWSLANFCRINIKNNAWRIAKKILSKKVKQIQQRWGWTDRNCNGTAKETKVNHYENYVVYIFTIF